jgi:hypothetical protein
MPQHLQYSARGYGQGYNGGVLGAVGDTDLNYEANQASERRMAKAIPHAKRDFNIVTGEGYDNALSYVNELGATRQKPLKGGETLKNQRGPREVRTCFE